MIGSSVYPHHTALARRLQAYLTWRNANARHPGVLAAQRRERPHPQRAPAALGTTQTQSRVVNPGTGFIDSALMTDCAVDPFPKKIGMPVVPGILLDHVGAGEAHVQLKVAAWM